MVTKTPVNLNNLLDSTMYMMYNIIYNLFLFIYYNKKGKKIYIQYDC